MSKAKTARAKTPKEPLPPAERLKRLFTSLCAQIDGGHLERAQDLQEECVTESRARSRSRGRTSIRP
jgi:hypothetical protein